VQGDPLVAVLVRVSPEREVSLAELVASWGAHLGKIAKDMEQPIGPMTWGAHDYFAALSIRDLIQFSCEGLNQDLRGVTASRTAVADQSLCTFAELDERGLVVRFGDPPAPISWWWKRIPLSGLIRDELEEWAARIGAD
jgi:hypothetical protein